MSENYAIPKRVEYTESGQVYMSPTAALMAIFNGQRNWCTSNFLRGLFMMKLLVACACGIIVSSFNLNPFVYHWIFLLSSFLATYYLVVIKCKIDIKKVFHSSLKPYIHRMPHAYVFYFIAYYISNWAAMKAAKLSDKPIFK